MECFDKLYDHVDYFTVNVSSPNTPNLRDLQNIEGLKSILIPLIEENNKRINKPILLKISPDLADSDIISIIDLVMNLKVDGIISTNTTIKRDKLNSKTSLKNEKGGLSGSPLTKRSTDVIRLIHKHSKGKVPIVGVGGIMSPEDALEKLNAGASLIQVYTGFIYNGPSFIYNINKEIIKQNTSMIKGSFCSIASGFAGFCAHSGGTPISVYLVPLRLEKTKYVGTRITYFFFLNIFKLI